MTDLDDDALDLPSGQGPSLLDQIKGEVDEGVAGSTKRLRVGRIRRLSAEYRGLLDEERTKIEGRAKQRRKLAKKVGDDGPGTSLEAEVAAEMVALACVQLLWTTDSGVDEPLHELLGRDEPLRFNAELLELIAPDEYERLRAQHPDRAPSSAEVVKALHQERYDGRVSLQPLRTVGSLLQVWMSGVSTDALEDTLEGL